MALPHLLLILADNQAAIAEGLHEMGVAKNMGWPRDVVPAELATATSRMLVAHDVRAKMSHHGRLLVDGMGAQRVFEAIAQLMVRA